LVTAARDGDEAAFDELIHRYERYVWSAVNGYRLSTQDAHDVVQITWLRLVENLGRLREPDRVGSWLATTASRECLRVIRHRDREVSGADEMLAQVPDDRTPSPEQQAVDDVMAAQLWRHVAALPDRGQILLTALSSNDAPAYAELSRRTGMPLGSIGPTRGRYLRRLRQVLEAAGMALEDLL
jgi:RNA polymerase sigma factor (sigma-70 family)